VVCWFDPKLEELSVNRPVGLVSSVPHERNMKVASRSGSPAGSRCDRSVICDNRLGSRTGGGWEIRGRFLNRGAFLAGWILVRRWAG
jgi:hypothetical protein